MTPESLDAAALAAALTAATRAGDLPAAYRVIVGLAVADMEAVALRAGLSIIFSKRPNDRRAHIQRQIAAAAHDEDPLTS